jgi:hypothetical protein
MKNVYVDIELEQFGYGVKAAMDVSPSAKLCAKAFSPESARLGDTDEACEVAGG